MFVNRLGAFVLPFLSLYLREHEGLGAGEISVVMSAWGAGCVVAGSVGGQLSDRWGRKPTMLLSLCAGAAALAGLAAAHGFVWLAVFGFVLGSVAELYRPAVAASIADLVPAAERARAFSNLMWAYNLGFAVSPVLAGLLVRHTGYVPLFVVDAATMLLAAIMIAVSVPETRPVSSAASEHGPSPSMLVALRDLRFLPLVASAFLIGMVVIQLAASLAHVMRDDGIDAEMYGRVIALNGALIVVTQPWIVPRLERLGRYRVMPCAAVLFGAGFTLHAVASSVLGHALAVTCWTLGEVALFPLCNAAVADFAPESMRGRYQGTYWTAWSAANVAGPPLGLYALEHAGNLGWGALVATSGMLASLALVVVGSAVRRHGRVAENA
jgi:MFS family permease